MGGIVKLFVDIYVFKISCNYFRTNKDIIMSRATKPYNCF